MPSEYPAGMAEAAGLTRAGRLGEATALIQRLLGGGAADPDAENALPSPAEAPPTSGATSADPRFPPLSMAGCARPCGG